ncbi:hypothetical protein WS71_25635 [Burkholderia mayonis]|uniref:Uncharacterized protein n=1 Tax=Burkholderia mayonis TaxID=1385591 RepID=A0A1B4G3R7_9BURK|nr:hypothetical protein WS71_25635 [Burkholderia mayonis]KVE53242.1 hypothetical protein WS71_08290 [Burkholderia mayonis]
MFILAYILAATTDGYTAGMRETALGNIMNRLWHQLHCLAVFYMVPCKAIRWIATCQANLLVGLPEIARMVKLHVLDLDRLGSMR